MTDDVDFGPAYQRPAWAMREEVTEDGEMIFFDGDRQQLWAIAFTGPELRLLRQGLAQLPQSEDVQTLHDKLQNDY